MATVCNNIISPLVVSFPSTCVEFTEHEIYPNPCGAGSSTDSCSMSISGGQPPYQTTITYGAIPNAYACSLNMNAFTGGSGPSVQFGYGYTASNMCVLSISGTLRVNYTVTDAANQTLTGSRDYAVNISHAVQSVGGGGGGGGIGCVSVDAFVITLNGNIRAGDVVVGDKLRICDPVTMEETWGTVTYSEKTLQPAVKLTTTHGNTLTCSYSAPIPNINGDLILAPDTMNESIIINVLGEGITEAKVNAVSDVGNIYVQHITVEDKCFWASDNGEYFILHHNLKKAPNLNETNPL